MPAATTPISHSHVCPLMNAASRIMSFEKKPEKPGNPEIASAATRNVRDV